MTHLPHGLHYVSDADFTGTRAKHGAGLAIPPAWKKVKVCTDPHGHIQAVGFDDKGRKQYIYHPDWIAYNQQNKFDKMIRFAEVLPTLRDTVAGHLRQHQLSRERILATITWLLEHTFIRIGNKTYEKENQSYGLTTLHNKHTSVTGNKVKFSFKGKSGVYHELDITHPRIAQTIQQCIELPGYELFQYVNDEGQRQSVDSHQVNEYLREITGEVLSAKDFRTWGGTSKAGDFLFNPAEGEKETEQNLLRMVEEVASHLGNTVAVCRQYYIHPLIFETYRKGTLLPHFHKAKKNYARNANELSEHEYAIWTLLKG